jgi:hypothetical protein
MAREKREYWLQKKDETGNWQDVNPIIEGTGQAAKIIRANGYEGTFRVIAITAKFTVKAEQKTVMRFTPAAGGEEGEAQA